MTPGHVIDRRSPVFVDYGSGRGIKAESGRVVVTPVTPPERRTRYVVHLLRCPLYLRIAQPVYRSCMVSY